MRQVACRGCCTKKPSWELPGPSALARGPCPWREAEGSGLQLVAQFLGTLSRHILAKEEKECKGVLTIP